MSAITTRKAASLRLATFGVATALTSIVGLIAASVFVTTVGSFTWGVLAAIQSAAMLFGVLVAFGWGTTGAAEIASAAPEDRPQLFADSFVTRLYLLVVVYPAMVAVMTAINPQHADLVLIGSLAFLVPNLGAAWYFVGEAAPKRLVLFEVLPQTVGLLASIGVILITGNLVVAVAAQLACNVATPLISLAVVRRTAAGPFHLNWSLRAAARRLGHQRHSVTTAATSALYVTAPMLILNIVSPGALAPYAMGDRLFRVALTVFSPVLQFAQGWIPEGGAKSIEHRIVQTLRLTPLVSILGAVGIAALGPLAVSIISQEHIAFGFDLSIPFALIFAIVSTSQVVGLACLVQLGKARSLAISTVLGAALGVPALVLGTVLFGVHGAAWALLASEIVVLVYQLFSALQEVRHRRQLQAITR